MYKRQIQEDCDLLTSDNLIIYGHHISGNRMFGALEDYKSKNFYEEHKNIRFDTLTQQGEYEIIAVFKTVAYSPDGLSLIHISFVSGGLVEVIRNFPIAMQNPFSITVCEDSVKTVLIFLLAYGMGIGIYFSTRRNYRRREEHGSAKWGDAKTLNKKYADKNFSANKLLTQTVRIGLNGKKHRRNLNILVCGGSGAGKTRFYCKPNAMQCDAETSMVILDPKGEIVRDVGGLLEKKGYEVRVLDLINKMCIRDRSEGTCGL